MIRRLNQIYIKPLINMSVFIFTKNVVVEWISTIAASQDEQTVKWMSLVSIFPLLLIHEELCNALSEIDLKKSISSLVPWER